MPKTRRRAGVVFTIVVVLLAGAGSATAASTTDTQQRHADTVDAPAFVVAVHEDGDARVTVTYTYNLSDSDRREAFQDLQNTDSVRSDFRDRFASRMASVASNAANRTGREMSVENATVEFRTEGDTGVVEASITWNGLAATDGDSLTVTEPFASGFQSERPVHVFAPGDYSVEPVTPSADSQDGSHLRWDSGTDMTGFELVVTAPADDQETDDQGTATPVGDDEMSQSSTATPGSGADGDGQAAETAGDSGPGFGVIATVTALLAVAALAGRR